MTVNGLIDATDIGVTLEHEHILVNFISAEKYIPFRWDRNKVIEKVFPYLVELRKNGCNTLIECTPAYLGRDVQLLKMLSDQCQLNIITNTGYYGAGNNKYIPEIAYEAETKQLAGIWIREFRKGIDSTGIRPGFIKISVNPGPLNKLHKKLVQAAGITHLRTGLTIASHTGPAVAAFDEIEVLKGMGVHPSAFIWIHAQNEKDMTTYIEAAKMGSWISLDGVNDQNFNEYGEILTKVKETGYLNKILISHDAGWYDPGKPEGGPFRNYNTIFEKLLPVLMKKGFSQSDLDVLLRSNPAEAFAIRKRNL